MDLGVEVTGVWLRLRLYLPEGTVPVVPRRRRGQCPKLAEGALV